MSIDLEFSRYAKSYEQYNIIQKQVTKELLSHIKTKPKKILDLGCGSGAVYKTIDWEIEHFIGIDFAKNMLELHPKSDNVECIFGDFENEELYQYLLMYQFDYIISSSALQWANNLDKVFSLLKQLQSPLALAIFTSKTFQTVHHCANITSPLRSKEEVTMLAQKHFSLKETFTKEYKLEFANNKEIFKYIKQTGVSGKRGVLSFKQTKDLIQNYPINYLEFEVLFLYT